MKVLLETSMGTITLELDEAKAPETVRNFVAYAKEGHYDGTIFHRVIDVKEVTSQFFINLVDNDFLDFTAPTPQGFGYAVFGQVTDGMEVVDAIAKVKTGFSGPHQNVPEEAVVIKKVSVG